VAESYQGLGELIPASEAPHVGPALAKVRAALRPASAEQLAVELARLFEWARTFGIEFSNHAAARQFQKLGDLPADLLAAAIDRTIQEHAYGMRLPMIAEIRKRVDEDLKGRHRLAHRLSRLDYAVKRGDVERPKVKRVPMTPEQQAEFDRKMAALRAGSPVLTRERRSTPRPAARLPYAEPSDDELSFLNAGGSANG
jgi:hypothetical protein